MPVDIRLVAATNKDLSGEIESGRFRKDLFFRLNIVHMKMVALCKIRGDIVLLATHLLQKYGTAFGTRIDGFSTDAMKALVTYS